MLEETGTHIPENITGCIEGTRIGQRLKITWFDAKTWSNAWVDSEDVHGLQLPRCVSYGEVIKEDEDSIFLVQSKSQDEYRNIIGIPKGCIVECD